MNNSNLKLNQHIPMKRRTQQHCAWTVRLSSSDQEQELGVQETQKKSLPLLQALYLKHKTKNHFRLPSFCSCGCLLHTFVFVYIIRMTELPLISFSLIWFLQKNQVN